MDVLGQCLSLGGMARERLISGVATSEDPNGITVIKFYTQYHPV